MMTAMTQVPVPTTVDERRVIPDIEIREAVIKACGLRSISDFQLLTLASRWDRYLGMTAAMTQVPVPTARRWLINVITHYSI